MFFARPQQSSVLLNPKMRWHTTYCTHESSGLCCSGLVKRGASGLTYQCANDMELVAACWPAFWATLISNPKKVHQLDIRCGPQPSQNHGISEAVGKQIATCVSPLHRVNNKNIKKKKHINNFNIFLLSRMFFKRCWPTREKTLRQQAVGASRRCSSVASAASSPSNCFSNSAASRDMASSSSVRSEPRRDQIGRRSPKKNSFEVWDCLKKIWVSYTKIRVKHILLLYIYMLLNL